MVESKGVREYIPVGKPRGLQGEGAGLLEPMTREGNPVPGFSLLHCRHFLKVLQGRSKEKEEASAKLRQQVCSRLQDSVLEFPLWKWLSHSPSATNQSPVPGTRLKQISLATVGPKSLRGEEAEWPLELRVN